MVSSSSLVDSIERLKAVQGSITSGEAKAIKAENEAINKAKNLADSWIGKTLEKADITQCDKAVHEYAASVSRVYIYKDEESGCFFRRPTRKPIERPLCVMAGKPGRGKTYSAAACLVALAPWVRVKFVTAEEIVNITRSRSAKLSVIKGTPFLAIDDLGNERADGIQCVKDVLDAREASNLPTIVTMQPTAEHWRSWLYGRYGDVTGAALLSRFEADNCVYIPFTCEDRRRNA